MYIRMVNLRRVIAVGLKGFHSRQRRRHRLENLRSWSSESGQSWIQQDTNQVAAQRQQGAPSFSTALSGHWHHKDITKQARCNVVDQEGGNRSGGFLEVVGLRSSEPCVASDLLRYIIG